MVRSLILCEGEGDKALLGKYLSYLGIDKKHINMLSMSGKPNFFNTDHSNYKIVKQQLGVQFNKVLFVLDADINSKNGDEKYGGYSKTESNIKNIISDLNIAHLSDFFIFCDPLTTNGNLEHFLLSTTNESKRNCIENLVSCIENQGVYSNKKIVVSAYQHIFNDQPYSFDHVYFNTLKEKLTWLTT